MNRVTILLKEVPTPTRCEEIALYVAAEHFSDDNPRWELTTRIPEDTPVHLVDQLEAEIRDSNIHVPTYLLVYGPALAEDSEDYDR